MVSCAHSSQLLTYERQPDSELITEWAPHDAKKEWWYFTGVLSDADSNLYFFQYTLFHGIMFKMEGFTIHMAITDLTNDKHYYEEKNYFPFKKCKTSGEVINCPNSFLSNHIDSLSFRVAGNNIEMELSFDIDQDPVWHGNEEIFSMGDPDDPKQDSYYLSYPSMKARGQISFDKSKEKNNDSDIRVSGEAWFDKQWGNFKMVPWQWFSLRFDDGDRVMLFYFPESGYKRGTYISKEGKIQKLSDFLIIPDTVQYNSTEIEMVWKVSIPVRDDICFVEPVIRSPYQKTRFGITYWEGLCRLRGGKRNSKGWCVVEVAK